SETLREKLVERTRDVTSVRKTLRRAGTFDVVVVNTAHDWRTVVRDIAVVLAMRRHSRPIVLQMHGSRSSLLVGPGNRLFKLATAALLALVDGVLVLSTEERQEWERFRARPSVFVVKNPYVPVFGATGLPTDRATAPRALFVGRLLKEKGVFELVEA